MALLSKLLQRCLDVRCCLLLHHQHGFSWSPPALKFLGLFSSPLHLTQPSPRGLLLLEAFLNLSSSKKLFRNLSIHWKSSILQALCQKREKEQCLGAAGPLSPLLANVWNSSTEGQDFVPTINTEASDTHSLGEGADIVTHRRVGTWGSQEGEGRRAGDPGQEEEGDSFPEGGCRSKAKFADVSAVFFNHMLNIFNFL